MYKKLYVSNAYNINEVKNGIVKVAVVGDDKPVPEGVYNVATLPYIEVLELQECENGVEWFIWEGDEPKW